VYPEGQGWPVRGPWQGEGRREVEAEEEEEEVEEWKKEEVEWAERLS
jgi:hypothetical protein